MRRSEGVLRGAMKGECELSEGGGGGKRFCETPSLFASAGRILRLAQSRSGEGKRMPAVVVIP